VLQCHTFSYFDVYYKREWITIVQTHDLYVPK
jgi:hypothetical protein